MAFTAQQKITIAKILATLKNEEIPFDADFDDLNSELTSDISAQHFSSFFSCKESIKFLCNDGPCRVLDIGSGTGKFCLTGAAMTDSFFTGIEIRPELYNWSNAVSKSLEIKNIEFILGDVTDLAFQDFNHFFVFNPFMEYRDERRKIDSFIPTDTLGYQTFVTILAKKLSLTPVGTKLVTSHVPDGLISDTFQLVKTSVGGTLRCYVKP